MRFAPVLSIDSSTARAYAAVRLVDGSIHEAISEGEVSHNEELTSLILRALSAAQISASDLRGIVVGSGPGSFTGLRIGYSVAKGMAFSLALPVAEISSHLAIALGSGVASGSIVVLGDARRDEYFCSAFRIGRNGQDCEELLKPHILPAANLPRLLSQFPADEVLRVITEAPLPEGVQPRFAAPKQLARGLAQWVKADMFQAVNIETLAGQTPAYLRAVAAKTIAERAADKAQKGS